MTGAIEPSEELAASFYQCTTCLNCKATCPAGVVVSDIVEGARRRLVKEGYLPNVFSPMLESLKAQGNPLGELPSSRTEVYPAGFEEKIVSPEKDGTVAPQADVLLYLGCVGSYQDLYIVPSMMEMMDQAGVKYAILGDQEQCCGYVAYLIGSDDAFEGCLEKNSAMFSQMGVKQIITTCAGCYKTFAELYPKHSDFDVPVFHAVQFMEQLISKGKVQFTGEFPKKVIYHDPCDIGRHLGIYEPPRNVLKNIPGLELIEFPQNRLLAKCCGGGGGMKAYDNDLSLKLAENRVAQAMDLGAEVIVSACPSCKSNLRLGAAKVGKERRRRIQVMDITEVLAAAI
jgi:glycolate oxidase